MGILDQLHEIEIYILLNQIFSEEGQCRLPALRSFGFPSHRLVCFLRWIPFFVNIFFMFDQPIFLKNQILHSF